MSRLKCERAEHEISTSASGNATFKMIESEEVRKVNFKLNNHPQRTSFESEYSAVPPITKLGSTLVNVSLVELSDVTEIPFDRKGQNGII